jgi:hypothetical protein
MRHLTVVRHLNSARRMLQAAHRLPAHRCRAFLGWRSGTESGRSLNFDLELDLDCDLL